LVVKNNLKRRAAVDAMVQAICGRRQSKVLDRAGARQA